MRAWERPRANGGAGKVFVSAASCLVKLINDQLKMQIHNKSTQDVLIIHKHPPVFVIGLLYSQVCASARMGSLECERRSITGEKAPSRSLSLELCQALWSEAPISSKKMLCDAG